MSTADGFGPFFRAGRKALGLTLREFCRRNGFDPGNVSRLERGLTPPPQVQQGLESYAKALKLERGTDKWDTFFELAAAETGRIPPQLLEKQGMVQKLPNLFRQLQGRGQRHTNWVRARHLEDWAGTLDSRESLPQLVRRLIWATGKGIRRIAVEQGQRPGWDGIVEAAEMDAFVPAGTSGWELGADEDPKGKAEADFKKRTKNSLGLDKKKTSFVFVTPRKWQQKSQWCQAKKKLGMWKDVRVYDSASLEEWLERSLVVDAWLAGLLGLRPEGVTVIDEYWANLQAMTDPSLKAEVFLTSRSQEVEKLREWLDSPPAAMVIEARSPAEVIDFVVAYSYSRDPSQVDAFAARSLIVENKDAWRAIAASSDTELLLISHPSLSVEPEMVAEAVRQGHRVLLPFSETPGDRPSSLRLPRVYRHDLEKALVSSGLDEVQAQTSARASGGSLTVLKRLLGRFPGTTQPVWSRPPNASTLVPMLLAGSWDESSDGDRSALEKLAGQPYSDVSEVAEQWLKAPDSPLTRVASRWSLVSRDDSWFLLAPSVTSDRLRRFEEVALEVFAENDPAYGLPPDKRWQASLHRKMPRYSRSLRTGLAETLALLGGKPERIRELLGLQVRVEQIVRSLLDGQDWVRWASLSAQLPLLAEAGPEVFLDAVERDLKRTEPALVKVFEQEGDPLFSSRPHTGILWALEGLAWNRSLLSQVSMALAQLDEKEPRGTLGNRPSGSLQKIFMPWFPQTTAPVEERVDILKKLVRRRPDAGWRLLVSLLPNQQPTSFPIHRPLWRDWALGWSGGVTYAEFRHQAGASAHLLVEHLGEGLGRWTELVKQFDNLPESEQKEFLKRLNSFDVTALDAESRRAITDALREKVSWHRRISDANWALSGEILSELEQVQRRFEPEDAVACHAWLFGPHWSVSEKLEREGMDATKRLTELRRSAIREILDQAGWPGVLKLVEAAEAPEEVGAVLAEDDSIEYEAKILPVLLVSGGEKASRCAGRYVYERDQKEGWDWVRRLETKDWSADEVARSLLPLAFKRTTWDFAAGKGADVAESYWRNTPALFRGGDGDEAAFAVSNLLEHKRPSPAFNVLRVAIHQNANLEPSLLMDALDAWLDPEADSREPGRRWGDMYDIHRFFLQLQKGVREKDLRVDRDRLARLEGAYLGLLDGRQASPVTLHAMLRDNPEFFVELLGLIFRPKNEPEEARKEVSEEDQGRAQNAYRLLMSWRDVPGSREDRTVDEKAVLGWVQKARALAEGRGLLEVCDLRIGEVFAHAPAEIEGSWPCITVRDAMEEIDTDEVFRGFSIGIYNKRGMHSRSPAEGGDLERALAQKYTEFAEASKIEWPKTAAALRRVAQGYEEDARREDAEALSG